MNKRIVFTGGGTAGHVTPNLALINYFLKEGFAVSYIGSKHGIEKKIISAIDIPFYSVQSGKLRRYFSLQNFFDLFRIVIGIVQAFILFLRLKPSVVFSKGGFVAFPVVVGAWLNRIPVVAHESDLSPGLANKLSYPFVKKICLTFEAGEKYFKNQHKIEVTGTPIRNELFEGDRIKGLEYCGFAKDKPCILVIGGSLGANSINRVIRDGLYKLTKSFQVIHICGVGKIDAALSEVPGYCQFDYVTDELPHFFAAADIVISRAGANSVYELLALGKKHILIPLPTHSSRGDQVENAQYYEELGASVVIKDEALNVKTLLATIDNVMERKEVIEQKIKALHITSATEKIAAILKEQSHV
jgi:UDP-N-acetylglucosamine--N-acetylmuramyl-(pentapeptide) pyrophosphoryl-undecaprenol N-acetylglucosamine transferase